jgi:cobalt-zinc-cadmium efflux system outer membrane protein
MIRDVSSSTSRIACGFILIFLLGCSGAPPRPVHTAGELIGDRIHLKLQEDRIQPTEVNAAVAQLLAHPLTANSAAQIALLNNPALAVQLEEVGIAEADYIAASQIKNPSVYVDFRLPDRRPPSGPDIEATAAEDVLDILLLPVRKKLAQQQLDQAAIRSADAALQLVHDTRFAFFTLVAHQQSRELQKQITAAAAASADFARRQHDAGNINDLSLAAENAAMAQAQLQQLRADAQVAADREKVNRLLGLGSGQLNWTAEDALPDLPKMEPPADTEIAAAKQRRLDIGDAQSQVSIADAAMAYTRSGILTAVNVGASMERETSHQTVIGPSLGLELPIFNQHQGQIARSEAELRQAKKKLDATQLKAESEIRAAVLAVESNRAIVQLATDKLIPDRVAITSAMQLQYNGMQVGLYELLAAKREELTARREAADSLLDYWLARAELDRAVGR